MMSDRAIPPPCWSTVAFGPSVAAVELERAALGVHLRQCWVPHQRVFALRCAAEAFGGFAGARIVSSLLLFSLALGLLWLLL